MADKGAIRKRVWDALEESGAARFPFPPHGRITNFTGAEAAAERAMDLPELAGSEAVKANPDAPQLPLRRALLEADTTVYMAAPRLRDEEPFLELDPADIDDTDAAPTVSHAGTHGRRVPPEALSAVDAIVVGSVAVTESGERIGKGEGYSDLEFAMLRAFGLVGDGTTVITTVHELQVVDDDVGAEAHDVPVDVVCTPERTVRTDAEGGKPTGIDWERLSEDRIEEIPVLERLRPE
ncbi:5-formyltetrahydrofolate cyclo-ligase [Halobacteriales archaeon SW_5_68_122]|nr:MAG: 5-formyltetrahydrofolate cyclo-ligase [Halobacteriales archaeon SW_5_68_122]